MKVEIVKLRALTRNKLFAARMSQPEYKRHQREKDREKKQIQNRI